MSLAQAFPGLLHPWPVDAITWALHLRGHGGWVRSKRSRDCLFQRENPGKLWFPKVWESPTNLMYQIVWICRNHQTKGGFEHCSRVKTRHTKTSPKDKNIIPGVSQKKGTSPRYHSKDSMSLSLHYSWFSFSNPYFQIKKKEVKSNGKYVCVCVYIYIHIYIYIYIHIYIHIYI